MALTESTMLPLGKYLQDANTPRLNTTAHNAGNKTACSRLNATIAQVNNAPTSKQGMN